MIKRIQNLLDIHLEDREAIEIIVETYLIAVGFRPLYLLGREEFFVPYRNLLDDLENIFPSLIFSIQDGIISCHHRIWTPDPEDIQDDKILGSLLRYEDPIRLRQKPSDVSTQSWYIEYKKVRHGLSGYIILGTTSVSQLTNKLISLRALLSPLNIKITVELDPIF